MSEILYFEKGAGRAPVEEWMDSLSRGNKDDLKLLRSVTTKLELLEALGRKLSKPHCECLTRGRRVVYHIYELKIPFNKDEYRIFYSFYNDDTLVLLHWIKKKTQEISPKDINLSSKRMKEWVVRHG